MIDELDPKHHVTLTKGDPKKITDLQVAAVDGGVHIEEMGDHEYWLRIGQQRLLHPLRRRTTARLSSW